MVKTFAVLLGSLAIVQASRGTAELQLNGTSMSIEYGRPSLRGRDLLSQAPVGTVWRLGADQSTTLKVSGPAVFGNMVVAKGEYSLFVRRVSEDSWSLLVNTQTGQWGTEHDETKDILGIPLKWEKRDQTLEQLTIELTKETNDTGILTIAWGENALRQRFRLPKV